MGFRPDDHIADGLQVFAEIWESDFIDFWGLHRDRPPEHLDYATWKSLRILYEIAQGFVDAAVTLQPGKVRIERVLDFFQERELEDPRDIAFVRQAIEVLLTEDIGNTVAGWRDRVLEVVDALIEVRSERARAYLMRLARCYIYDMKPEGAVMARAVLDTALQDLVDDDNVLRAGNAKHPRRVDLDDRLRHLEREQMISREAVDTANKIRQSGNDAVHLAPGAAGDLKSTLHQLKLVFKELDRL